MYLEFLEQIPQTSGHSLRVLVPGAGLGRPAHEIDRLGGMVYHVLRMNLLTNAKYVYLYTTVYILGTMNEGQRT